MSIPTFNIVPPIPNKYTWLISPKSVIGTIIIIIEKEGISEGALRGCFEPFKGTRKEIQKYYDKAKNKNTPGYHY